MRVNQKLVAALVDLGIKGDTLTATIELLRHGKFIERSRSGPKGGRPRKLSREAAQKAAYRARKRAERDPVAREILSYDDLPPILKARRNELGLTCNQLDDLAGLQTGFMAKLENFTSGPDQKKNHRRMGPVTMPLTLEALGLRLYVKRVEAPKHHKRGPSGGSA